MHVCSAKTIKQKVRENKQTYILTTRQGRLGYRTKLTLIILLKHYWYLLFSLLYILYIWNAELLFPQSKRTVLICCWLIHHRRRRESLLTVPGEQ